MLTQAGALGGELFGAGASGLLLGDGDLELARVIQELVKRRVEQAHDHIGRPAMALNIAVGSRSVWASSRSARACCGCTASSSDRMKLWMMFLRSPRNMCSVRQRPMASAPKSRASCSVLGVVGVGAHVVGVAAGLVQTDLVGPVTGWCPSRR